MNFYSCLSLNFSLYILKHYFLYDLTKMKMQGLQNNCIA